MYYPKVKYLVHVSGVEAPEGTHFRLHYSKELGTSLVLMRERKFWFDAVAVEGVVENDRYGTSLTEIAQYLVDVYTGKRVL